MECFKRRCGRIELRSGCREGVDLRGSEAQVVDRLGDSQGSQAEARTGTGAEGEGVRVWWVGRRTCRRRTFLQLLLKPGFCGQSAQLCSCVPNPGTVPQGAPSLVNKDSPAPPASQPSCGSQISGQGLMDWEPLPAVATRPGIPGCVRISLSFFQQTASLCCWGRPSLVLSPARGPLLVPMLRGPWTCRLAELDWGQVAQLCPWVPRPGLGSLVYPPRLVRSCSLSVNTEFLCTEHPSSVSWRSPHTSSQSCSLTLRLAQ